MDGFNDFTIISPKPICTNRWPLAVGKDMDRKFLTALILRTSLIRVFLATDNIITVVSEETASRLCKRKINQDQYRPRTVPLILILNNDDEPCLC